MKIDVSFSGAQLDELALRDKNVVVIDVLRSSTTIITALANGAREIIPVASVENAVKISGSLFGDVTLRGGERGGKMIAGFNLGNSPSEYSELTVAGKSIIYCTTNGTVAIVRARYAKNLVIGGFVNVSRTAEFIASLEGDCLIICGGNAGSFGNYSLEDTVCAGMIVDRLVSMKFPNLDLTDSSLTAHIMFKKYSRNIKKMLAQSTHGKYLIDIGFGRDLDLCAELDAYPILPVLVDNAIRLRKEDVPKSESAEVGR